MEKLQKMSSRQIDLKSLYKGQFYESMKPQLNEENHESEELLQEATYCLKIK